MRCGLTRPSKVDIDTRAAFLPRSRVATISWEVISPCEPPRAALSPQSRANRKSMKLPVVAALALVAFPAFAESVRVVDGDTLKIDGVTYRLWGIDAPGQPCADGWPAAATEHLRALIGDRHVTCEPRTLDRYGRTVALCRADGRDLGADMVADGHAWAFVRYSRDYVEEEREAAAVRAGIHGHICQPAWQWRSERRKN
jgi:endonuclease YncB( thermonuclease family)